MYRVEAVGVSLSNSNHTFKITILVRMLNLWQFHENWFLPVINVIVIIYRTQVSFLDLYRVPSQMLRFYW